MADFISFFVLLAAAVFFSTLFNRLHLPWVVALIVGGMVVGPFGLGFFEPNDTTRFLADIGLVFLMFIAGLETRFSVIAKNSKGILEVAVLNGLLPALAGVLVAWYLGYGLLTALLLGIIFISTSVAVVIPSLEANGLLHTRLGSVVVGATIVEDVLSLLLLSLVLQFVNQTARLPLSLYYPALAVLLVALRWAMPRIRRFFTWSSKSRDLFQHELRLVFVLLIGIVLLFEFLGLHPIIAGFFAGFVLSDSIKSRMLKEKIRAISYGIFIPTFFISVGAGADLGIFQQVGQAWVVTAVVVLACVLSKFASGFWGARLAHFSAAEAMVLGVATTPSLSTTLAVALVGLQLGIIDQQIMTALIILSVVTAVTGPGLIALFAHKLVRVRTTPLS